MEKLQSVTLTIDGKEGIFSTEKKATFFYDMITMEKLEQELKEIRKEIRKGLTQSTTSNFMLTLSGSDAGYKYHSLYRMTIGRGYGLQLELRPYDKYDKQFEVMERLEFGDNLNKMITQIMHHIKSIIIEQLENAIGYEIPQKTDIYSQKREQERQEVQRAHKERKQQQENMNEVIEQVKVL